MKVTVLIDSREQRPLIFPATIQWYPDRGGKGQTVVVRSRRCHLAIGDYCLEGHVGVCRIERKGSLDELANNLLSKDYARALRAFEQLGRFSSNPYLLIECTASDLQRETRWTKQPGRVMDALMSLTERLKLGFLLVGSCKTAKQKRVVGELVLRLMMAHAFQREVDYDGVDEVLSSI